MENSHGILSKFKIQKKSSISFGKSPEGDWKIIFFLTLFFALGIVLLSAYMFIKIDKGEIFVGEKPVERGNKFLDIERLKSTVEYYQNKANEFNQIKSSPSNLLDPSV